MFWHYEKDISLGCLLRLADGRSVLRPLNAAEASAAHLFYSLHG